MRICYGTIADSQPPVGGGLAGVQEIVMLSPVFSPQIVICRNFPLARQGPPGPGSRVTVPSGLLIPVQVACVGSKTTAQQLLIVSPGFEIVIDVIGNGRGEKVPGV